MADAMDVRDALRQDDQALNQPPVLNLDNIPMVKALLDALGLPSLATGQFQPLARPGVLDVTGGDLVNSWVGPAGQQPPAQTTVPVTKELIDEELNNAKKLQDQIDLHQAVSRVSDAAVSGAPSISAVADTEGVEGVRAKRKQGPAGEIPFGPVDYQQLVLNPGADNTGWRPFQAGEYLVNKGHHGMISTEMTYTVPYGDGKWAVVPGLWLHDGVPVHLNEDEAARRAHGFSMQEGVPFPQFPDEKSANAFAVQREKAWQGFKPGDKVPPLYELSGQPDTGPDLSKMVGGVDISVPLSQYRAAMSGLDAVLTGASADRDLEKIVPDYMKMYDLPRTVAESILLGDSVTEGKMPLDPGAWPMPYQGERQDFQAQTHDPSDAETLSRHLWDMRDAVPRKQNINLLTPVPGLPAAPAVQPISTAPRINPLGAVPSIPQVATPGNVPGTADKLPAGRVPGTGDSNLLYNPQGLPVFIPPGVQTDRRQDT